jgi:hypothetical protein
LTIGHYRDKIKVLTKFKFGGREMRGKRFLKVFVGVILFAVALGVTYWTRSVEVVSLKNDGPAVFLVAPSSRFLKVEVRDIRQGRHVGFIIRTPEQDTGMVAVIGDDGQFSGGGCYMCFGVEGIQSGVYLLRPAMFQVSENEILGIEIFPLLTISVLEPELDEHEPFLPIIEGDHT